MRRIDNSGELFRLFGQIHNHIYANDGFSPVEAFNEFVKLLFIKLEVEKKKGDSDIFNITESEYQNILDAKQFGFKKKINEIFTQVKKDYPDIFQASDQLNLKESTLAFVVKSLQEVNFSDMGGDIKGIAFQKFIFASQRGDRGQFLTPDPIIELIVNIVSPLPKDKIIDPACGTGGFLVRSLRYINDKYDSKQAKSFFNNLIGIEISPSILRLAKVRMILEGDGHTGIINADSLSDFESLEKLAGLSLKESFDLVLTNPPFGTLGKISDRTYLNRFSFAHVWEEKTAGSFVVTSELQNAQTPEILFIERCLELLKDGGRLAIVLPDGILENKTLEYVRYYLKHNTQIIASISLPSKTFIPHGTGVKTSVIIVQKQKPALDYDIFFSIINNVGYEGSKDATPIYKLDKNMRQVLNEDITTLVDLFRKFEKGELKEESDLGFIRKFSELENRFDAEFYKPSFKKLEKDLIRKGAIRLDQVVEIKTKKAKIMKHPNAEINYVEITDVSAITNEIVSIQKMSVAEAPSRASYELKEGDIITEVAGVSTGTENHASALVTKEFDGAICTNGFRVLVPKNVDPYYLIYYLRSDAFLLQMLRYRVGAAIPSVLEEDLRRVLIYIPEQSKQKEIAEKVKIVADLREEAKRKMIEVSRVSLF